MSQTTFTHAILDPAQAVPPGLTDPQGRPAGKRFSVYRNNVAVSLTEALQTAFPVIHQLLGDEFFKALAGVFLRQHPPASPLMMFYGAEMPGFLDRFEPVQHLGYLPDVARLELALRHSYHAADCRPLPPAALAIEPERLLRARLRLAPAVQVLRSPWPVHGIWAMHQSPDAPKPQMQPEDVLITRPDFDPVMSLLPAGGAAFILALSQGETFETACDMATEESHNFNLTDVLGLLLSGGALCEIQTGGPL